MSKITATKIFTIDMAHTLPGHEGLCRNLHGHTYTLEVTVSSKSKVVTEGPSVGMVIDFSHLKDIVKREIVSPLDHATVLYLDGDFERELSALMVKHKQKVVLVPYRPTAELMAEDFFARIVVELQHSGNSHLKDLVVEKVKLWETPTSFAEVSR